VFGVNVPGFNLSVPKLPYLASGGIVTQPTLAVIGEAGAEAVVPLSRANEYGLGGGGGSGVDRPTIRRMSTRGPKRKLLMNPSSSWKITTATPVRMPTRAAQASRFH
jgi:hypothetical protein